MSHIYNKDCREAEREFVTIAKQNIAFFEPDAKTTRFQRALFN